MTAHPSSNQRLGQPYQCIGGSMYHCDLAPNDGTTLFVLAEDFETQRREIERLTQAKADWEECVRLREAEIERLEKEVARLCDGAMGAAAIHAAETERLRKAHERLLQLRPGWPESDHGEGATPETTPCTHDWEQDAIIGGQFCRKCGAGKELIG